MNARAYFVEGLAWMTFFGGAAFGLRVSLFDFI